MDIKPGYLLKVTTWENDGDNYNTCDIAGLTEAEVRFYLHVCNKFKCSNWAEHAGCFGNEEIHGEAFYEEMMAHIAAYEGEIPQEWQFTPDEDADLDDEYHYQDLLGDLGIESTEYGYWRVFERAEVFLVPAAIQNVTDQFK